MHKKILAGALLCALLLPFSARGAAVAQTASNTEDFTITSFAGEYYLNDNDKQGSLKVTETIDVFFRGYNHGILRALPRDYKGKSTNLEVTSVTDSVGANIPYTTYESNGNLVLKIGDANKVITGAKRYIIDYRQQNVVTFYDDHDEWYWDINGDGWSQEFTKVSATLHTPASIKGKRCFTGKYGSSAQDCTIENELGGTVFKTTKTLKAGETLSVVAAFNPGYFTKPPLSETLLPILWRAAQVVVPAVLLTGFGFVEWRKKGKDLKGRGTIIPAYEPPKGFSAAESAAILNYAVSPKAISATIIDLAIRKYVRIAEVTEKKIFKDGKAIQLELRSADYSKLKRHEVDILDAIFPGRTPGEIVKIDSLKNKLYKTQANVQKSIMAQLVNEKYFPSNPITAGAKLFIIAGVAIVLGFILGSWLSFGLVGGGAMLVLFGSLMKRRTAQGVAVLEEIKGLKLYIETAEADRIKMLQSVDAKYAPKTDAPARTVELFEKLLPFAIILGVEKTWAKEFEHIYTQPPEWYSGNWTTFSTIYLINSIDNSVDSMSQSFAPAQSSSGSGMGGGGFSGGGGGGGGGGGW